MGNSSLHTPQGVAAQPATPTVDPGFAAAVDKANTIATDYQANIPVYAEQNMGIVGNQARQSLAQALSANTANANSRGFLYSGLKQGADVASQGQYADNLANAQTQINSTLQNNANDLKNNAISIGQKAADAQQNYTGAAQQTALDVTNTELGQEQQNAQNYAQAGSALGSAVGGAAGLLSGNKNNSNGTGTTDGGINTSVNANVAGSNAPTYSIYPGLYNNYSYGNSGFLGSK
jgi:hypothetical protein